MGEDMLFILRDAFTITGRGTVLAGDLVAGSVAIGGDVVVTGPGGDTRVVRITGVERDRKLLDRVSAAPTAVAPSGVPAAWLADPDGTARAELLGRHRLDWARRVRRPRRCG
ncbi:MAG: hypothetical protein WBJ62_06125 [Coriobacteriia bacterium]